VVTTGRRVRGHPGEGGGQHLDGSPASSSGGVAANAISAASRSPCIGRQAGAQPPGRRAVGHVDRVAVDDDAGDDLGHRPRRDGPVAHDDADTWTGDAGSPSARPLS
jgi:hypothetical protein